MSLTRAMPHQSALARRRAASCSKCKAGPHELCRQWIPERYTTFSEGLVQGEGRWKYLKRLHAERKAPR